MKAGEIRMEVVEKKILKQKLKIYLPFTLCTIQDFLSYKGKFYFYIAARILNVFMNYYLWVAIYKSSNETNLSGFTMKEMSIYIFMSFVASSTTHVSIARQIGTDVVEGSVAVNLIKPINYKVRLFFSSFGQFIYQLFIPSLFLWIGLLIYEYEKNNLYPPSLSSILLFFISMFLSFIIQFFFEFCFGMLAFYTTYIWGMTFVKATVLQFLSGQILPLAFFPRTIQKLFDFMPFSSMNYIPVMIYMGKIPGNSIIYALVKQSLWIVILWLLSQILWNKAVKKLIILGG